MSFNTGFFISSPNLGDTNIYEMVFDGVNEYIQIPHNEVFNFENTDSFSITADVDLSGYVANQSIFSRRDLVTSYRGYLMYFSGGDLYVYLANTLANIMQSRTNGFVFVGGTKYRIGFSYNGSQLSSGITIYVNGVSVSKIDLNVGLAPGTMKHSTSPLIGADFLNPLYANGSIGTIRIWNDELTASEFLTDYNGGTILNNPIRQDALVYGFRGGQNALFGTQWVFPDESQNIINPSAYSVNMEYVDRILIP